MDLAKLFSNPTAWRILMFFEDDKEHTTKEVAEYLSDIPVPTLYRHINYLIENGLLIVKEERKVRGSRERILVTNNDWLERFSVAEYSSPFFIDLINRFNRYVQTHQHINSHDMYDEDRLFLAKLMLYLDDDEMDALVDDYNAFAQKYVNISEERKFKNSNKGKLRIINIISAPGEFE